MPTTPNQLVFSGEDRTLLLSALSSYARSLLFSWVKDNKQLQELAEKTLKQLITVAEPFYPDQMTVFVATVFKNRLVTVYKEDGSTIQVTPFDYWSMSIRFRTVDDEPTTRREELGTT